MEGPIMKTKQTNKTNKRDGVQNIRQIGILHSPAPGDERERAPPITTTTTQTPTTTTTLIH